MAKKNKNPVEVQANKDTGEFVKWFFETYTKDAPDRTDYIQGQKTIKGLLYDEDGAKTYTIEDLRNACISLYEMGVDLDGFSIVMWPGLVRAASKGDILAIRSIAQSINAMRGDSDSYTQNDIEKMRPSGW